MCDGRNYNRQEMYFRRASLLPQHPVAILLQGGNDPHRWHVMANMTNQGYRALAMNEPILKAREQLFPDCATLEQQEIETLPKFVKNYRCGGGVEKGEPMCDKDKWTNTHDEACQKRRYTTSWHPGWYVFFQPNGCFG